MDSVAFIWRHFPQKILINLQDETYIFKFTAEPQNLIAVGGVEHFQNDILQYLAAAIQKTYNNPADLSDFVETFQISSTVSMRWTEVKLM